MIKTAKEILLEKGIDLDAIRRENEDSRKKQTMILVEFITEWLADNEPGVKLMIKPVREVATKRGFKLTSKDGEHHLIYKAKQFNDPSDILKSLGFIAYWPSSEENEKRWKKLGVGSMPYDPWTYVSLPTE